MERVAGIGRRRPSRTLVTARGTSPSTSAIWSTTSSLTSAYMSGVLGRCGVERPCWSDPLLERMDTFQLGVHVARPRLPITDALPSSGNGLPGSVLPWTRVNHPFVSGKLLSRKDLLADGSGSVLGPGTPHPALDMEAWEAVPAVGGGGPSIQARYDGSRLMTTNCGVSMKRGEDHFGERAMSPLFIDSSKCSILILRSYREFTNQTE